MRKIAIWCLLLACFVAVPAARAKSVQDLAYINGVLDAYKVAETDEPSGGPSYYGFQDDEGFWYIMKETVSGDTKSYRYTKGTSGFSTNWTNRASLTYDTFENTF